LQPPCENQTSLETLEHQFLVQGRATSWKRVSRGDNKVEFDDTSVEPEIFLGVAKSIESVEGILSTLGSSIPLILMIFFLETVDFFRIPKTSRLEKHRETPIPFTKLPF